MLEGLDYLHHPLRAQASAKYVKPSLDLLWEIQKTGDIFFPTRWMNATLSGHTSPAVAATVRDFLEALPANYPAAAAQHDSRRRRRTVPITREDHGHEGHAHAFFVRSSFRSSFLVLGSVLSSSFFVLSSAARAQPPRPITLRAARVIDGRGQSLDQSDHHDPRLEDRARGGPPRAPSPTTSASLTLLPGFIDTHVHIGWHFGLTAATSAAASRPTSAALYGAENAYVTLMAGFTTVQSVGAASDKPLRDAIARGILPGPRILTSLGSISNAKLTPDQIREEIRKQESGRRRPHQDLRVGQHSRRRHADAVAGAARRGVRRSEGAGAALDGPRAQRRSDDARRARRLHRRRARRAGHARSVQAAGRARRLVRSRTSAS